MDGSTASPSRVDKKRQTRDRILANAIAIFRTRGVRRTRLSEVAQASGVSTATLFNYFPTKGRLAEAWVRGEVEELLSVAIQEAVEADRSLRSAIRVACRKCAEASNVEPSLRLEAWQETGRASGIPLDGFGRLVLGLAEEQKRERVRADLAASDLAGILMDAIEGGLISGLRRVASPSGPAPPESSHAETLFRSIRSRVDLAIDGFRKRNERVLAPINRPEPRVENRSRKADQFSGEE